ncbi:MAG: AraC family transcriptional regulator ligand-binding domain-containing protein [Aquabacterium sp.]|nr:AraC family transcriptional regulator ligand-binding domain-containing protein [Aquabacterium sp.]
MSTPRTAPALDAPTRGIQAAFVRVLPDTLTARGLPATAVWDALGLAVDEAPEHMRVPVAALCRAIEVACRLTGDPLVLIQAAQAVRPLHLGSLGYALMSSSFGEDGLLMYERFQTLLCDELLARHRVAKGLIEVRHETVGIPLPRDARFWWLLLGARLAFARWVSGRDLVPVRIDIPAPRPPQADAFDRFIGCAARYDTPDCRELMPADWLAWLNPNADPAMHALMHARTAQQMAARPQGDALLMRIRLIMAERMGQGLDVSLDALTQALHADSGEAQPISARQLQKRLADQGLSFKDLVEEVRRERALRLLRDSTQAIGDIAAACGYTEVSPFHRAVRRWTGLTPAQVRQQAMSTPAAPTQP